MAQVVQLHDNRSTQLAAASGAPPESGGHLIKKIDVPDMPTYSVGALDGFKFEDGQIFKIVGLTEKQASFKQYCGIKDGAFAVYRHCGLPHKDGVFEFIAKLGDTAPYARICVRGFAGAYAIPINRN